MEAQECCILGICCAEQKRIKALADKLQMDLKAQGVQITDKQALAVATDVRALYDLWPKGLTLQQVIDLAAAEAREYEYQQD